MVSTSESEKKRDKFKHHVNRFHGRPRSSTHYVQFTGEPRGTYLKITVCPTMQWSYSIR